MQRLSLLLIGLLLACTLPLQAQGGLTFEEITSGRYVVAGVGEMRPMPDGEHYTMLAPGGKMILLYAYKTGAVTDTLFNIASTRETQLERIEGYLINSSGTRILVWKDRETIYRRSWKADIYDYDVRRNYLKPLSETPGKLMLPTFSPDGRMCAFVRDNNIWLKKFDYDTESQVTRDGAFGTILNGSTDWVYEEEFEATNLMSWSIDSQFLAYVKSDESEVPLFTLQHVGGTRLYPTTYTYKYPKAGQPNSRVNCFAYNVETRDTKRMEVPLEEGGYIPMIRFTENEDQLAIMTLNRHQNSFKMYYVNPKSMIAKLILQDNNDRYIDYEWIRNIRFSKDHFIYVSERDGFAHIYLYTINGVLEKQITSGAWDVTALYGFHPQTKTVYYQSAEESPLRRSVYKIDAKGIKSKLSTHEGSNKAVFSTGFNYFVQEFSNLHTPPVCTLYDEKGKALRELYNASAPTQPGSSPSKEFFTFTGPSGDVLNGWILKPTNFSANKQYPVLMVQYSGPNSQEVRDRYAGPDWYHALLNEGFIVACVDGRGTAARGEEFRKCTYLKLGQPEAEDQVAAAQYLGRQSYIDQNRIGIWGWSFGGTMTLMAMSRGQGTFKVGVAIAPVTDWRLYDTVYTERFMRTPNENFVGYSSSSAVECAKDLQGKLLLVHGALDDNVHYQNTMHYADALVQAGKQFEMQIYPSSDHGIYGNGGKDRTHLNARVIHFLKENL